MPVPQTLADLSTNPPDNYPKGSDPVGNQQDEYERTQFAFIAQVNEAQFPHDGSKPLTGPLDAGANKLTNLAAGTADTDAATMAQLNAGVGSLFKSGMVMLWSGTLDTIPAGWLLCNGQPGTPNLADRFVVAAGRNYGQGATGGADSIALTAAQMPSHNHAASTDAQGQHSHGGGTYGAGNHTHHIDTYRALDGTNWAAGSQFIGGGQAIGPGTGWNTGGPGDHAHGIPADGSHGHNVSIGAAGGSGAHENRPAFYALAYIIKT